ncbi:MAG TPA: bifunctional diaminohydroxyphosphoribosylaminopyrimidine deaminase/5-amino-6-(5-phosphoribosylamino)uracil reductase RibD [Coriobacteriia bacterium]|nr:bifunctional diaminohydroxyphosphoribosylaminopyrimidine deaminase/5-amino-6-(5-phosphoribosylamino)uracil reductase RibD [Coriobacteriia bacterium]
MRLFSDVASRVADPHLSRAVALAARALGHTAPNPLVGCVVVREGQIVGEGYHPRAGEPHAEVFALAQAGASAQGADVYVTLEPCRHHGRTPPCVDAVIASGASSVVIGMLDPSPEAGGGVSALRHAGLTVKIAEDPTPFQELNAGWLMRLAVGRPRVTVKLALTLDGRVAFSPGQRAAITGPSGATVTRRLRAMVDAVLVGARTVHSDDPALTVRDELGSLAEHQPLRVVLSRSTVPGADSKVFSDGSAPTLFISGPDADRERLGALPDDVIVEGASSLSGALDLLGTRGVNDVLIEPGAELFSALWREGLVDELVTVTAGGMGGSSGLGCFDGDVEHENNALIRRFSPVEAGIVGDVSVVVWRPSASIPSS